MFGPVRRQCSHAPEGRGSRVAGPAEAPELPGSRRKAVHQQRREDLMRRASTCLAVLGAALLMLPAVASATPEVKFKALAVPIPGYPETGNLFNAGAAVEAEYQITSTEYLGAPPPLKGINFYLPAGVKLNTKGWATCTKSVLEPSGPGPAS